MVMDNFIKYKFKKISESKLIENSYTYFEKMKTRRTVREFSEQQIPEEVIVNILKTAATSPSGANKQPWFFYVIKDRELKRKIRTEAERVETENYKYRFPDQMKEDLKILETDAAKPFLEDAPYLIVVCKELYRIENDMKKKNYYVNESVGIAIGLLISAIHFTGLATVPYTPNPMSFLKKILKIPDNLSPVVILPVGYPIDKIMVPNLSKKKLYQIHKIL